MSEWIEAGQPAPDFKLPDANGEELRLSSLLGRKVVIYFYPKDDTPGCTQEACSFRDRKADFKRLGATILGISPDDGKSHLSFIEKYGLNFKLLSDKDHQVSTSYGAWREITRYGKKVKGIKRSTFLVDPDGVVAKVWKDVRVEGHDEAVLKALESL